MALETIGPFAWLIPTFTLAAFVIIVALVATGRGGRTAGRVGVLGIGLSTVVGLLTFAGALGIGGESLAHHPEIFSRVAWTPDITFGIMIDPLSAAVVAMVTIVCSMIFIYSTAYMEGEVDAYVDPQTGEIDTGVGRARYGRFFAYISLFATGMLGFVLASNLLQALIFWEIMGVCSFLLIGFWYHKPSAADAAKKAFLTTRIGDMFFFIGIMALFAVFGTVDYETMLSADGVARLQALGTLPGGLPVATVIALLVFGGAVGKSAQFPLHVWLPDAMEGPTPVSALIHAATMVAAGVFLVARMFPLFSAVGGGIEAITPSMWVVAAIGGFTALFAATIGAAQFDIKRVLAYSTISQLGYMVMALGIGAYVAAVFHVITHAFFKALLFLGSGSVIHGVEHGMHHDHGHGGDDFADEHAEAHSGTTLPAPPEGPLPDDPQDMRNMGGLRERMPLTFWTYLAGTLALTGIPIWAGFWSKDEILAEAFHKGLELQMPIATFVWLMGTLAAFMTAFYMARQIFMVFFGPPSTDGARHAPESAPAMVYPLIVLAVFATFLGLVGVPESFPVLGPLLGNPFHHFTGALTATGAHFEAPPFSFVPMLISVAMAALGWAAGWFLYGRAPARTRAREPLRALGLWTLPHRKYFVDELYAATVVRGTVAFAALNGLIDRYIVDGLVNGAGIGGEAFARLNGWVDTYIVDGTVNLIAYVNGELSRAFKLIQSGRVQQYLLVVFFSLLFLVGAYVF